MASPKVHGLFPVPFMHAPGVLDSKTVARLRAEVEHGDTVANSKDSLLSHTAVLDATGAGPYSDLQQLVQPLLREFGSLLFGEQLVWMLRGVWMNRLEPGGQQAVHSHANSFISGIAYLSHTHPSARTVFYRGMGGRDFTFSNDHAGSKPGPFNAQKWAVPEVSPGDLVLFPSYMLHEVPPNRGERRVTLAFNAIPERLKSWDYEIGFR